jgi:magnesium transporter
MLRYFVRRSRSEEFQKVATPPKDNVWIHGDTVHRDDLDFLAATYGFDLNVLLDVLDANELPRVEQKDGDMYVFVRTAQRGKHGKITTTPVLLAMRGTVFANVSTAATIDHDQATPSIHAHATDTPSLLLGTFAAIVSEYEDIMQHTSRYIHDTGQRLRTHEVTNDDFIHFVTIEDNLNEYKMNLNGMLVIAERLREALKSNGHTEAIEDILQYIRQLVVAIDRYNQSITSIRNAYGTVANNVLNQRMKTLTVFTVLIALPNVFYGMYGMNVLLPFQNESWAYPVVVSFSIIVIILTFTIARKKRIF